METTESGHHLVREELEAGLHGGERSARRHQHHREELDRHVSGARLDMLDGVLRRDDRREPQRQDLFLVLEMRPRARITAREPAGVGVEPIEQVRGALDESTTGIFRDDQPQITADHAGARRILAGGFDLGEIHVVHPTV